MYRLLIVDDEYLSRYALRTLIQKKFNNIEIVGEAENGRQALELNSQLKPDIIIMDIKMPVLNGIDASAQIINEYPETNILILTAYDSFDYIKNALDIGVLGYILKPIKEAEVVEKINKVINQMIEKTNHTDFMGMVESKINVVKPFIEDELVTSFITGIFDKEKTQSYIDFLQEDIKAGYFLLVSTEQYDLNGINDYLRSRIVKEKTMNILKRHLPLMKKCFFGKNQGNSIVVFIPVDTKHSVDEIVREAIIIGHEINRKLEIIGDIDATVGIGGVYSEIDCFCRSYSEAVLALRKASKDNKTVHFNQLDSNDVDVQQWHYPTELEDKLIEQLKAGNISEAKKYSDELLNAILCRNEKPEKVKEYVFEYITMLKRAISKLTLCEYSCKFSELYALTTPEEIKIWGTYNTYELIEKVENNSSKKSDVMNRIIDYINRNFNKNITLDIVAMEVGLSPQYLSKIFKEQYGSTFIEVITKKRIKYAEELLSKGNKNIKEISKLIGYEDPNYFCRVFRKETGKSPKQFRITAATGV
ncbi:MAG: response regulator [Clostridiaceae bacterium]|mgnify:CR=1 FL=1|nr:response regulator [Clostridiaceae bacterium]